MNRRALLFIVTCLLAAPAHATEVQEVVSEKGIKAWLVEEHSLPIIAAHVSFEGSGFAYDPKGMEGRANMAAALLTEGAGHLNEREFNLALEAKAIDIGTVVNEDRLEVAMQTLAENKDEAFSYLGMVIAEPRFDSTAIARTERQIMSILKQAEQDPGYILGREWNKQAFGDHPYAKPQLGTKNSIGRIGRSDFQYYASHYLTRENLLVSVVGDITPEALKPLLDKHFAGLPEKYKPEVTVGEAALVSSKKPEVVSYAIPQTLVAFGVPGLKRNDPDYIAAYVMNQILGGGTLTSRLGNEIREERGLAYSVGSYLIPFTKGGVWRGEFATRNDQVEPAMDVLLETLKTFAEKGPTVRELEDAKEYLIGSFPPKLAENANMAAFLINMQHNKLGLDYLDKRDEQIRNVSRKDVQEQAKRLIDTGKLVIVMVGNPEKKPSADAVPSPH